MENMCKEDLMNLIQKTKFAMIELALYLDTHPDCPCGLEAYHAYQKENKEAEMLYEAKYGPLTICGVCDSNYWTWVEEAWPWQKECE